MVSPRLSSWRAIKILEGISTSDNNTRFTKMHNNLLRWKTAAVVKVVPARTVMPSVRR